MRRSNVRLMNENICTRRKGVTFKGTCHAYETFFDNEVSVNTGAVTLTNYVQELAPTSRNH